MFHIFSQKPFHPLLLLSLLISCPLLPAENQNSTTPEQEMCHFNDMVGEHSMKLGWFRKKLKTVNEKLMAGEPIPTGEFKNRLILHGPHGNGKTTIARKMAAESGSKLLDLTGPSIVRRYVGEGAERIEELFSKAREHADLQHQAVVIFIDEIDAIAANNEASESRSEHKNALQQLWLELDKIKNDQRFVFVCTTNHLDKLDKTFLDRFGSNAVEIQNPDENLRRLVLKHYIQKRGAQPWQQDLLEKIVTQTNGLSIRCLEDLVTGLPQIAESSLQY